VFAPELRDPPVEGVAAVSLGKAVGIPANGSIAPLGLDLRMLIRFDLGLDPAEVIHVHEPFLPASLAAVWRAPRGVPVVGTFHAAAERFLPYALARPILRPTTRRLAATTAVSPAARRLVRRYAPVDPELVPNGVDVDAYTSAEPDPWAAGLGTVVLFVGRAERRKGFDVALRAFVGSAAGRSDVHLVTTARPQDVDLAAEGVAGRVHCLGPVPDERKIALYHAADLVVVPSLGGESFGIVVLEAMAAGAAVLASDIPGYRYAGGDAPVYVPPGDVRAWRMALDEMLDDPARREEAAKRGRARARDFDWSHVTEQTLAVYERVLR
jgi:phosphatidylinositol alpha-mannosyltransferase